MTQRGAAHVLVVEDSESVRDFLTRALLLSGLSVSVAADGESAVRTFIDRRPDCVLLDVGLPLLDGWGVLERLRTIDEDVPVLMLTGDENEPSKVRGLMGGADDYVVKPIGPAELLARVTALLRRRRLGNAAVAGAEFTDAGLSVDFANQNASMNGIPLGLTPREFNLLAAFVRRAGETLSAEQLMEMVWNDHTGLTTGPVKVYVGYLRRKLGAAGGRIETVRGFGYRYVRCSEDAGVRDGQ
jgi:DNA-binding response OmpR family regulator